ncbi:MAG: CNNM domain-containing protein, partial [Shewanella sp.]
MDAISTSALLIILLVLILFSAYFSGSETAMMTLNRYRLRHLASNGHKGAMRALKLL